MIHLKFFLSKYLYDCFSFYKNPIYLYIYDNEILDSIDIDSC
ncbi:hypothetical protein CCP3SC1AL1_2720005 [Gammaproteobacteria bacterium]